MRTAVELCILCLHIELALFYVQLNDAHKGKLT